MLVPVRLSRLSVRHGQLQHGCPKVLFHPYWSLLHDHHPLARLSDFVAAGSGGFYCAWRYSHLLAQLVLIPFATWHLPIYFHFPPFNMEPYHRSYLSTDVNNSTITVLSYFSFTHIPSHVEIPTEQPQNFLSWIMNLPQLDHKTSSVGSWPLLGQITILPRSTLGTRNHLCYGLPISIAYTSLLHLYSPPVATKHMYTWSVCHSLP